MATTLDRSAVSLSQRQLGVIARWQLRRSRSEDQVDGAVRRGLLVTIDHGVYRVRGSAIVPGQRAVAAALRARTPATLTGPAVLGLYGVDGFDGDDPFEVLVPAGRRLRRARFRWRVDPEPERAVSRRGAVRLTSPADAVVHSAAWRAELGDRRLRLAVHWLGWRGLVDRERLLERLVADAGTDPDARTLLDVLGGSVLARCESEGEVGLGSIVTCSEPAAEPQVWLTPRRRTDWYLRSLRLAIEYQGRVDHGGAMEAADRARAAEISELGIEVFLVTDTDLANRVALLERLVAVMVRRAVELGVPMPRYVPPPTSDAG